MKRYYIREGFLLQSANPKRLMQPGQYYVTEDENEIAELDRFAADKSCEESKSDKKNALKPAKAQTGTKAKPEPEATAEEAVEEAPTPEEDITVVPGVGKTAKKKLENAKISTLSALRDAFGDSGREEEELKTILGLNFEKAKAFFTDK